ncbi:hypothetical protein PR048_016692 [Dryococelus australis]|uniref:Uncharacterized protein n=1 Tax=Dryococelus australis TaxID=614101 RepID=A0ABQ9H7I5_9NEOP|nr:hypothetical protein PR048_016692 [Dryococelus australis]
MIQFHQLNISFKKPQIDTCYKCGILNTIIKVETDLLDKKTAYQFQVLLSLSFSTNGSCESYNLTMYDSTTTNSRTRCYVWHGAEGARGGNQIATCIYEELESLPPDLIWNT